MTSEIRSNTIKNRAGLGTVTFSGTGAILSGIVTASDDFRANEIKNQSGLGTITVSNTGAVFSGILSATKFVGDGTGLTGNLSYSGNYLGMSDTPSSYTAGAFHRSNNAGNAMQNSATLFEDDQGRIGIGQNTPGSKLHIKQNSDATYITIESGNNIPYFLGVTDGASNSFFVENGSTNNLIIKSNSSDYVFLYGGGQQRIETTNTGVSISGVLDATGDLQIADKIIHAGDTNTSIRFPSNDTISFETSGSTRLEANNTGVNIVGSLTVNGSAVGGGGGVGAGGTWASNAVGINTTKNVGIGSTLPSSALDVDGDAKFTGIVTFSGTEAIFNRVSFPQSGNKTIVGNMAGGAGPQGSEITCVGYGAGYASSGNRLTAIGRMSGKAVSGTDNTCIGYEAGYSNEGAQKNVFVGKDAGMGNKTGSQNVIVGSDAGEGVWNNANYSDSVIIGYKSGDILTSSNSNVIVIGSEAEPSSNSVTNEITLGNSSIATFRIPGLNMTIDSNGISDAKGNLRKIPKNSQNTSYTLVASDSGKFIYHYGTGGVTIPSGVFDEGDAITIVNGTTSDQTITCSAVNTALAGDTSFKSSLTLKGRGMATILFIGTGLCYASGAGLE